MAKAEGYTIYAYKSRNPNYCNWIKVGQVEKPNATRGQIEERTGSSSKVGSSYVGQPDPEGPVDLLWWNNGEKTDGTPFQDYDVRRWLERHNFRIRHEWVECTLDDVLAAYEAVRLGKENEEKRTESFPMRPEQKECVDKTSSYFRKHGEKYPGKKAEFLWNAKMRFGKTFTAYELSKAMGLKKVLVLTFKPAAKGAWRDDLLRHTDFEGWQFVSKEDGEWAPFDPSRPFVCFGSLQDFLGKRDGGIKEENRWAHEEDWDMVILDEYHFGAWREKSKHLFSDSDLWEEDFYDDGEKRLEKGGESDKEAIEEFLNAYLPIKSERFLYLSGTPFRMLENGEFLEDQIYSWTYEDEQKAKREWKGLGPNPYASLPEMEMYTYALPEDIAKIADKGEAGFDLNEFFKAEGRGRRARFIHREAVQQWLDLISGKFTAEQRETMAKNNTESHLPYSPGPYPSHSLWFLPGVASCEAMENLLKEPQNERFASKFKIVLCAGKTVGNGIEAKKPVMEAAGSDPEKTCTITLSCGKLTTGVTVPFWSAVFMLRSLKSPETYFQTAFRAQSPWGKDGKILKERCFIFDFSPIRVLKETAAYVESRRSRGDEKEDTPERKLRSFLEFLPIFSSDLSSFALSKMSAKDVLDFIALRETGSLLAKKWKDGRLVNVTDDVLERLLKDEALMEALSKVPAYRKIKPEAEKALASSREAEKLEANKGTAGEKQAKAKKTERKKAREEIRDRVFHLLVRIPVFMYLTDDREKCVIDVIRSIEPKLFEEVTGINVDDFNECINVGLLNAGLMNEAVWAFRDFEGKSLEYSGIDRHKGEKKGGWNEVRV
ncbi:MAG: restriction endonuclease [Aeriscardovia sp.]|nr:restriction endonuclease [Aeriscardovia sp.]